MLTKMLDGCQHRGPDSTGFAMYHARKAGEPLLCRIYMACAEGSEKALAQEAKIKEILGRFGAKAVSRVYELEHLRLEIEYSGEAKPLCYAIENEAKVEIFSIGRALEIVKGIGSAWDVERDYKISRFTGTHGIGHVRLATESVVDVSRAHPFWAYGFNDVAIVHNGQITNYFKMKRRLMKKGLQFRTDNDSELVAVYLADKMNSGYSLEEVLEQSVRELDGTFSFLVSTADGIGFAKDALGAKPMVALERDGVIAVASEEVSLNKLFPGAALSTFEPFPGTFKTWRKKH
jgi:glutamate synthase domain-containing protein 1